jgi:hypothetical protein
MIGPAVLDELFQCVRYTRQMAIRHCLRHQAELEKGGGRHSFPLCAFGCDQGKAIRERCPDVLLRACESCGAALIGLPADAPCSTCEARRAEQETPPKVLAQRGPVSERIWTEKLPEPPLVPPMAEIRRCERCRKPLNPKSRDPKCWACREELGLLPHQQKASPPREIETEKPTEPTTEESEMSESEKTTGAQACSCGRGIRAGRDGAVPEKCFKCRKAAGETPKRQRKPKPGKTAPLRAAREPLRAPAANEHDRDAANLSDDELVRIASACAKEMKRRIQLLRDGLQELETARKAA